MNKGEHFFTKRLPLYGFYILKQRLKPFPNGEIIGKLKRNNTRYKNKGYNKR